MEENIVSPVNAEPVANVEPQTNEPISNEPVNSEPLQANNAEPAEPQQEPVKPVQSKEDNARFAEIRRRAEQEARDRTIAEMGMEWNGKPIRTYSEYVEAKRESELRQQYQNSQLPEEVVNELVESKKFRQQYEEQQMQLQEQTRRQQDYQEFLQIYPEIKPEEIPVEVWEETSKGKSLVDAYAKHEAKLLKNKVAEYEKQLKAYQNNQANAQTSPGSVTGNGTSNQGYFTREQVEAMSVEQVKKNYKEIMESQKHWK